MSPIFLPSFHHAIHHTSGASPRSTVLLQRTRSSKSIFQTFSTALIFIEIYRILKRSTSIDNFYRIIQTGHKTYRNFNKISIYLATVTPSLNFFIASAHRHCSTSPLPHHPGTGSGWFTQHYCTPTLHSSLKAFSSHSQPPLFLLKIYSVLKHIAFQRHLLLLLPHRSKKIYEFTRNLGVLGPCFSIFFKNFRRKY